MNFYVVDKSFIKKKGFAESEYLEDDFKVGLPQRCPVCKGPVSMLELLPPIEVLLRRGFLADFLFGEIHPFILSHNVKEAVEENGLTGFSKFIQVEIFETLRPRKKSTLRYYLP
jgi:hypothetical protein